MKTIYTNDLQAGSSFNGQVFALIEVEQATDKNNNPYYNLVIGDRTGRIKAKLWTDAISSVNKQYLKAGKLATIDADVESYKGELQVNIKSLQAADENKVDEYLESSSFNVDDMLEELQQIISTKIPHPDLQEMFAAMFADNDFVHKLKYWPAGVSIHHAFRSGLLQHILETLAMTDALERFYPEIDFGIARAGIIVHDIGKLEELDASEVSPVYTLAGTVLGHIYIGAEIVARYYPAQGDEKLLMHLKHIILSHHGEKEKGSPVLPATPEAMLVHKLEDASSRIQLANEAVKENIQTNGLTSFNRYTQMRMWADRNDNADDETIVYPEE